MSQCEEVTKLTMAVLYLTSSKSKGSGHNPLARGTLQEAQASIMSPSSARAGIIIMRQLSRMANNQSSSPHLVVGATAMLWLSRGHQQLRKAANRQT